MLIQANALQIPLADRSVHCVVTSPPYWGLRKYEGAQEILWPGAAPDMIDPTPCVHEWAREGFTPEHFDRSTGGKDANGSGTFIGERGIQDAKKARGAPAPLGNSCLHCGAWRGQLGLEPTIEMYVSHMVQIFREVRRVLRDDGTLWLNLGDSYARNGGTQGGGNRELMHLEGVQRRMTKIVKSKRIERGAGRWGGGNNSDPDLKEKDLCGIPWRVALALQADGWYLRSDIIWAKPNPMPESVTDRPTKAHEYIFLLTKSSRYFFDADAVKEESVYPDDDRKARADESQKRMPTNEIAGVRPGSATYPTRNIRSVWEITTQPYAGAHFATFPEEIPYKCIAAGTSERGVCQQCGAPWKRIVETKESGKSWNRHEDDLVTGNNSQDGLRGEDFYKNWKSPEILGWKESCACKNGVPGPALVFDPFGGSGTVGEVALKMGRRFILLDLAYQHLQLERIGLFAHT